MRLAMPDFMENRAARISLYVLYTVTLFLIFVVTNFPHERIIRRAISAVDFAPFQMTVDDAAIRWTRGVELEGLVIHDPRFPEPLPLFETKSLYVRPSIASILSRRPDDIRVYGPAYSGNLDFHLQVDGNTLGMTLNLDSLEIGRYRYLLHWLRAGGVTGALSGKLDMSGPRRGFEAEQMTGEFRLVGGGFQGAYFGAPGGDPTIPVPDMIFDDVTLRFHLEGRRLMIDEFVARGPQLNLDIQGEIVLQPRLTRSQLNLVVKRELGPAAPKGSKMLLKLIPSKITGILNNPKTKF